jgi:hypothetical protein
MVPYIKLRDHRSNFTLFLSISNTKHIDYRIAGEMTQVSSSLTKVMNSIES